VWRGCRLGCGGVEPSGRGLALTVVFWGARSPCGSRQLRHISSSLPLSRIRYCRSAHWQRPHRGRRRLFPVVSSAREHVGRTRRTGLRAPNIAGIIVAGHNHPAFDHGRIGRASRNRQGDEPAHRPNEFRDPLHPFLATAACPRPCARNPGPAKIRHSGVGCRPARSNKVKRGAQQI
jgi:hypothetical protein